MPQSTDRNRLRILLMSASLVLAPAMFAGVIETSPAVPPADGSYSLADTCVSVICLENITITNFNVTSSHIVGGNEQVVSSVDLTANAFQNVSGVPGTFISPITLSGEIDITYLAKDTLSALGTFASEITGFDLSGSFVGLTGPHQIEAMLNPLEKSLGQTTIDQIGSLPPSYEITSSFTVFAELKIDDGPFVAGPPRDATLTATPEPASAALAVVGLLMAAGFTRRRWRVQ
jgi:uncharacterized protein (TIGR03382 family)